MGGHGEADFFSISVSVNSGIRTVIMIYNMNAIETDSVNGGITTVIEMYIMSITEYNKLFWQKWTACLSCGGMAWEVRVGVRPIKNELTWSSSLSLLNQGSIRCLLVTDQKEKSDTVQIKEALMTAFATDKFTVYE